MFRGLKFFLKAGWKYDKCYILWRSFYQIINSMIPIVSTIMPKFIIDELLGSQRPEKLVLYIGILLGYVSIATALSHFFSLDGFTRRCHVSAEFDSDLHALLARADFENLENPDFLDMQEKAKKFLYCDWHGFGYLFDSALNILGQAMTLLGIIVVVASLNIWLILVFLLIAALEAWVENGARKKAMKLSLEASADQRGWMYYARLFDDFHFGKEIRIHSLGDWLLKRERLYFTRVNRNLKEQNDAYIRSGIMNTVFTAAQQLASYVYLVYRVTVGTLSIGSFTMYVAAVTQFSAALRTVMDSVVEIRAYDMYYENLDHYLSTPARIRAGRGLAVLPGSREIVFENVGFRYGESGNWVLRNLNLTIGSGERLAIVGENGAGKSTFVKLLVRLYDPVEGRILLDGRDIREIDYDQYTALFSTAFQDYKLFSFSLKENVALNRPQDAGKVEKALRYVGFGGKLDSLPAGIDTPVYKNFDPSGFEPSGGEGQKIALARALYRDTPIVILDEPTAALDPQAEMELYEHFNEMTGGKTAVYITHRLASARFCSRILVFEDGNISEQGSHEELMERDGKYAELFAMQAKYYK